MKLTAKELSRILKQPGYGVADGSLIDPLAATSGPEGVLQTDGASSNQTDVRGRQRASRAGRWRNEWEFQSAVIAEAQLRAISKPAYGLLVAIPNGQYRQGQRPEAGIRAGMPDLILCAQRGGYGALFIELKVGSNKPSRVQIELHHRLREAGYRVEVIWDSVDEVMQVIEGYLQ